MGDPIAIKLRRKYRRVMHGQFRAAGDHQGNNKRTKIGYDKHVAKFGVPRPRVMVVGPTGKRRMEYAT